MEDQKQEEIKKLVLARFGTLNPNAKILLMSRIEPISVMDMIKEIKEDSDFGKKIVEAQYAYIKMLASGELDK